MEACKVDNASATLTAAGALSGRLQVSLIWYSKIDLDLHVYEPSGSLINWLNTISNTTDGQLQLDSDQLATRKVENIYWNNPTSGHYRINVARWSSKIFTPIYFLLVVNNGTSITQISSSIMYIVGMEEVGYTFYEFDF